MTDTTVPRFGELELHPDVARAIDELGFMAPTPVQAQAIPFLRAGRDLLAQAQTGTGKTAAFAIPIIEKVDPQQKRPQALIVVPTRELCVQVTREFGALGKYRHAHEVAIYGGVPYGPQERALALQLIRFEETLASAAMEYTPHLLTAYLWDVAKAYSRFFDACPVLKAEGSELRQGRLTLCDLTARVIQQTLALLGIRTMDRM